MNFTVLIPARLASTRLPNKPLADIAGLPMVVRVAQRVASQQGLGAADPCGGRLRQSADRAGLRRTQASKQC
jgi:hypothetical protein